MDETTRPLTAQERRILEGLRTSSPQGSARFGGFLAFLVTLGLGLIVSPASWQVGVRSLAPVALALTLGALVFLRLQRSRSRIEWLERVGRDLDGGVARVSTYRVRDAIQVEESEDEGSQYYLLLDDGRVVFLCGQYLYEPEEDGSFPSSVVSVVRAPSTNIVFDARCEGTPLRPSTVRSSFTTADYDNGRVPEDGALIAAEFDSLRGGSSSARS